MAEGHEGEGGAEISIMEASPGVISLIMFFFLVMTLGMEFFLERLRGWLRRRYKLGMLAAVNHLSSELMLLGAASLILTAMAPRLEHVCMPTKDTMRSWLSHVDSCACCLTRTRHISECFLESRMCPVDFKDRCNAMAGGGRHKAILGEPEPLFAESRNVTHEESMEEVSEKLKEERRAARESAHGCDGPLNHVWPECGFKRGYAPVVTNETVEQIHMFLFVITAFHILVGLLALLLSTFKLWLWRRWAGAEDLDLRVRSAWHVRQLHDAGSWPPAELEGAVAPLPMPLKTLPPPLPRPASKIGRGKSGSSTSGQWARTKSATLKKGPGEDPFRVASITTGDAAVRAQAEGGTSGPLPRIKLNPVATQLGAEPPRPAGDMEAGGGADAVDAGGRDAGGAPEPPSGSRPASRLSRANTNFSLGGFMDSVGDLVRLGSGAKDERDADFVEEDVKYLKLSGFSKEEWKGRDEKIKGFAGHAKEAFCLLWGQFTPWTITKQEYSLLRSSFYLSHSLGTYRNPELFHRYIVECNERDGSKVVGLGLVTWVFIICWVLLSSAIGWCAWMFSIAAGVVLIYTNTYLLYLLRHATRGGLVRALPPPPLLWRHHHALMLPFIKLLLFCLSFVISNSAYFGAYFGTESCFFERTGFQKNPVSWWFIFILDIAMIANVSLVTMPMYALLGHTTKLSQPVYRDQRQILKREEADAEGEE